MADIAIKSYDDVWNLPIVSYSVTDPEGNKVLIQSRNPAKHSSSHPIEQNPTLFHNLGVVVNDPHEVDISTSQAHKAIESRKKGIIKIYKRKNFISELQIPGFTTWKGDMTEVVVLYSNDPAEGNYTKTYHVFDEL